MPETQGERCCVRDEPHRRPAVVRLLPTKRVAMKLNDDDLSQSGLDFVVWQFGQFERDHINEGLERFPGRSPLEIDADRQEREIWRAEGIEIS